MNFNNKIDEINFHSLKINDNQNSSFAEEYESYRMSSKIIPEVRKDNLSNYFSFYFKLFSKILKDKNVFDSIKTKLLKEEIGPKSGINDSLRDENECLRDENECLGDEIECLRDENDSLRDENELLKKKNESLIKEKENVIEENEILKREIISLKERFMRTKLDFFQEMEKRDNIIENMSLQGSNKVIHYYLISIDCKISFSICLFFGEKEAFLNNPKNFLLTKDGPDIYYVIFR